MRFRVEVDDKWKVKIRGKDAAHQWQRAMVPTADGLMPTPDPDALAPGEARPSGLCGQTGKEILTVYDRIVRREHKGNDIVDYGSYLFHCLLGSVLWQQIKQAAKDERFIELALLWSKKDVSLSRLHWEMMYDGTRFLAGGLSDGTSVTDVAITRLVLGGRAAAKQIRAVPRILFIVGTSLDESSIRPGAEIMSLLQQAKIARRINPSVLENASPKTVVQKLQTFQPDVVHFICHGRFDKGAQAGILELNADPPDEVTDFDAISIAQWLKASESPPQVVVLSACESGAALGPEQIAPLAAELVTQDIPVVIGMSGRVSDMACRLFTRQFGEALVFGDTLVAATAKGRRAALSQGDAPRQSPDWAYPTVYLSPEVDPDYAPAPRTAGNIIETRLKPYGVTSKPIFCGRQEAFEKYRNLVAGKDSNNVLAIYVDNSTKGYGRTRLLEELTTRAVADGHVPCAIFARDREWKAPNTVLDFAVLIDNALQVARESLGLPRADDTPISRLQAYDIGQLQPEDLPLSLRLKIGTGSRTPAGAAPAVTGPAVKVALERQFAGLMKEASDHNPPLINAESRVIVLLDDADEYISLLYNLTTPSDLGVRGFLGTAARPVPVIMTFSEKTTARDFWTDMTGRAGWDRWALRPFDRSSDTRREDMRVYARILMNPFDEGIAKDVSGRAWFMNYHVDKDVITKHEQKFGTYLEGLPAEFKTRTFYMLANYAFDDGFLTEANDEQLLREQDDLK